MLYLLLVVQKPSSPAIVNIPKFCGLYCRTYVHEASEMMDDVELGNHLIPTTV